MCVTLRKNRHAGIYVSPLNGVAPYAPTLLPLLVHHTIGMKTQKRPVLPFGYY